MWRFPYLCYKNGGGKSHTQTYTHTHTHTHTHTDMYTHTYTHIHTHTYTYIPDMYHDLYLAHLIHHQMCYCYQKLEIWKISGADRERIPMWCVLANQRLRIERASGADREGIRNRSPAKVMWYLWANQRLRKSEWITSRSAPDPLPIGSAPKSHMISLSQSDVP